ncbi:protein-tyrosine phosphatase [Gillisia sp. Hel1_33_143]|uniref:tyrosine-protein phosphatase n=1 Tax=Gillisia sp. Hel1_33_143 TaxID=1336796 RepID=UPI00087B8960|nr:CpsB/CapC family capsule biosynthesis tyrosine phosphatase [Gillisia sp. Hel1_33_143]SDS78802.1 protein-tyrosine phosphatase [Gillisia sp. Hel1_33_143]
MLSIFKKKEYLKDHLDGITDIHNHILPGIDDGASTIEESLILIKKLKSLGVRNFIATPHIMNDYYPNTPETIGKALSIVKEGMLTDSGLKENTITAAAEYMMDHSFLEILRKEQLLTLKGKYVLVEMSYFQAPINLNEILFQLQTRGYKPVLAHPERYAYYHASDLRNYEDLISRGCLFQLNTLSLTSHYGKNMEKTALKLLEAGMYNFIGSDTHRIQHLEKLENIQLNKKTLNIVKSLINNTKDIF